ncbi:MAG: 3-methyl-2-oxobutanoate dehydrogenase subunit beta [Chloroflexi bacterium]|nr:3-methyl-2-oxobutanoate dehydrogenase subunit beta [Chloroflexota bacterium]
MSYQIPEDEYMYSGDVACPGCGAGLAMRLALKALGPRTILVLPASCWSIIAGPFPYSALSVPVYHTAFETGGSTAAGVRAALDMKSDRETTVVTWAGDGGTFDIGLQALSGAVERNENFIYVCYDNEAYMNTGIQRSSATPFGAWTSTTPIGHTKDQPKKDMVGIMAAHRIPYAATANIAYPEDLVRKFQKARAMKGSRFIHILATCPPGWRIASDLSVKVARMAVQTRIFPLYEVENGVKYTINVRPKGLPVSLYLKMQDRFKHLTAEDMAIIQENVDREWERLEDRVASS